jgi:hypothetical protein
MATRMLSAVLGLALVALAFPATRYLANDTWTIGTPGFWLLVAGPGLLLLATAARWERWPSLLPLLPLAVVLLGLDVTDSARSVVVAGGYAAAAVAAVATVASAAVLWRRSDGRQTRPA